MDTIKNNSIEENEHSIIKNFLKFFKFTLIEIKVLKILIKSNQPLSVREICNNCNKYNATVNSALNELKKKKICEKNRR